MHPEVLKLIVDKLTELVQKDLGYPVRFEWPKDGVQDFRERRMTMIVTIDRPLNPDERKNLEDWCLKNLGAEWPRMTLWDRLRDD